MKIELLMCSFDSSIKNVCAVSLNPSPIQLRLLYSKYRFAFLKIMLQFPALQLSNVLSKVTSCSKQEVHTILFDYYLNLSVYITIYTPVYLLEWCWLPRLFSKSDFFKINFSNIGFSLRLRRPLGDVSIEDSNSDSNSANPQLFSDTSLTF